MLIEHLFRLDEHVDARDALAPYRNDPNIYISYTDVPKIGINPQSPYNTPLGVYAYPLREMWPSVEKHQVPFAAERPYINVIRAVGNVVELTDYSDADYARDVERLEARYEPMIREHLQRWHKPLVSGETPWASFVRRCRSDAMRGGTASYIWNLTRMIADTISTSRAAPSRRQTSKGAFLPDTPVIWNAIFRSLGYDGFVDRTAIGVIHIAEPCQAVFFSSNAFRLVERVPNVRKMRSDDFTKVVFDDAHALFKWVDSMRGKHVARQKRMLSALADEWATLLRNGESEHFAVRVPAEDFRVDVTRNADTLAGAFAAQNFVPDLVDIAARMVVTNPNAAAAIPDILDHVKPRPTSLRMVTSDDFVRAYHEAMGDPDEGIEETMRWIARKLARAANEATYDHEMEQGDPEKIKRLLGPVWGRVGPFLPDDYLRKLANIGLF